MTNTPLWKEILVGGFPVFLVFAVLSAFIPGSGVVRLAVPTGAVLLLVLAGVLLEKPLEHVMGWFGAVALVIFVVMAIVVLTDEFGIPFVTGLLAYTVWIPFVSLVEYAMARPSLAEGIVLGGAGIIGAAVLYTGWKTGPAVSWSLVLRMIASPLVLGILLVGLFTAVWRIIAFAARFCLSLLGIGPVTQQLVTTGLAVGLLAGFVYLELRHLEDGGRHADATPVTPAEFPDLHSVTTMIASQLDVPKPTIAVTNHSEPEALTTGYRPGNTTLVLSEGLLDALDDAELEAVVAHELAHVANMDAMVMTVASLPLVFAEGLRDRVTDPFRAYGADDEDETTGGADDESDDQRTDDKGRSVPPVSHGIQPARDPQSTADESNDGLRDRFPTDLHSVRSGLTSVFSGIKSVTWGLFILMAFVAAYIWLRVFYPVFFFAFVTIGVLTKYISHPVVAVLSRARESAADRTAATVTGSPMSLASALRTLDERITETPSEDLRESSSLSSLSILPFNPIIETGTTAQEAESSVELLAAVLTRIMWIFFGTHPATERRIDTLTALSAES